MKRFKKSRSSPLFWIYLGFNHVNGTWTECWWEKKFASCIVLWCADFFNFHTWSDGNSHQRPWEECVWAHDTSWNGGAAQFKVMETNILMSFFTGTSKHSLLLWNSALTSIKTKSWTGKAQPDVRVIPGATTLLSFVSKAYPVRSPKGLHVGINCKQFFCFTFCLLRKNLVCTSR